MDEDTADDFRHALLVHADVFPEYRRQLSAQAHLFLCVQRYKRDREHIHQHLAGGTALNNHAKPRRASTAYLAGKVFLAISRRKDAGMDNGLSNRPNQRSEDRLVAKEALYNNGQRNKHFLRRDDILVLHGVKRASISIDRASECGEGIEGYYKQQASAADNPFGLSLGIRDIAEPIRLLHRCSRSGVAPDSRRHTRLSDTQHQLLVRLTPAQKIHLKKVVDSRGYLDGYVLAYRLRNRFNRQKLHETKSYDSRYDDRRVC